MQRYSIDVTDDALERYELRDRALGHSVRVAPARGAMVTRFDAAGAPVLFIDDATLRDPTRSVRGGIPLLFPIAGPLSGGGYTHDGARYAMRQHGFARELPWSVVGERAGDDGACLTLRLASDDVTRAQYPFEFELDAEYTLADGALTALLRVRNCGRGAMPVQPGAHPYFYVDAASKGDVAVDTDATRAWNNVAKREEPVAASPDFAAGELDLHLLDHTPRGATLRRPGRPDVALTWSDNHATLVLWTLAGRDFVCVEPWSAPADALNRGDAIVIAPDATETWWLTIRAL